MKLILDCCCNHLGLLSMIARMIAKAETNNVDYIKFQLYTTDKLNKEYPNFEDVQKRMASTELGSPEVEYILDICKPLNITPMFTVFDEDKMRLLVDFYTHNFALKVASPDMLNHELILKLVKCFPEKEHFVSCGMHSDTEIKDTKELFRNHNIKWLYCQSIYPTPLDMVDYKKMKDFDGFSDHTIGLEAIKRAIFEIDRKDFVFEKHYTLSKELPIVDKDWSVDPGQLQELMALVNYNANVEKYKNRWRKNAC